MAYGGEYTIATAVTKSDTEQNIFKALYVGTGGNISIDHWQGGSGANVLFSNVADGTLLPVKTYRVNSTGTTATGIVGLS